MKMLIVGLLIVCGLTVVAAVHARVKRKRKNREKGGKDIYPLW